MNTILLISAIFGFVLITLLFYRRPVNITSTLFLAAFYFIFAIYALQTYVIVAGHLDRFPWFYAWPLPLYALISVPIYFYFITIFKDGFRWKWKYLLLFVPFLLSSIDVFILYAKPNSIYNEIVHNAILHPETRFQVKYGLLTLNQHYLIRHLWQFSCLVILFPELRFFIKLDSTGKLKIVLNRWLLFFFFSLMAMSLLIFVFGLERIFGIHIFQFRFYDQPGAVIITGILYLVILGIGVIPVYFPSVLYGFPLASGVTKDKNGVREESPTSSEEPKFGLDIQIIEKKLELMKQRNLFLAQDFDLTACARALEIPTHHLSYFLNQCFGLSFSQYRNHLRMLKAKELIDGGFLSANTIEALAWECGFASRSSFSKTFKKLTEQSLSDYLSENKDTTL
ncbi:helix-turn-helix domain-containing protein [Kriegella aquimaris]|uniref:AraC-type DNA-binding protein n=1 Tax=Kriegella aquimaris TaxID=192904 RepID=A0A1G9KKT9_9FLAO|nr:AraC family transcriptional regulator [Kriegella aquimaris]SDL50279.1 AraC-type DNA-binding protein [Kriegella aquimaris]